jgi:SAM-dependent methyltransferase
MIIRMGANEPLQNEFNLTDIAPWGRRLDEYEAFFALSDVKPGTSMLDVAAGPASFAAEAVERGWSVVAADPIYNFEGDAIRRQFEMTTPPMREGLRVASYRFKWSFYGSEERVYKRRREALELFLQDFQRAGKVRYLPTALPNLSIPDGAYDLALVSHFLFLYGDCLDGAFHLAALRELLRVAREVRVFPLVNLDGRPSSHLPAVMQALEADGFMPELLPVDFEFQVGATKMLRVRR